MICLFQNLVIISNHLINKRINDLLTNLIQIRRQFTFYSQFVIQLSFILFFIIIIQLPNGHLTTRNITKMVKSGLQRSNLLFLKNHHSNEYHSHLVQLAKIVYLIEFLFTSSYSTKNSLFECIFYTPNEMVSFFLPT